MSKDDLGDRIKANYEDRTRYFLPRRTYTIIRLDGKAFHTFTRGMDKPYDANLVNWMDIVAFELCQQIQGSVLAYTQSDEISILMTDFTGIKTDAWFDGNLQKIVSVAASIATAEFNRAVLTTNLPLFISEDKGLTGKPAYFDARAFTIPDATEVGNYFIWRQRDAVRNSISMLAQSLYSHKELHGKSSTEQQELCFQKGKNWNDVSVRNKRGGFIIKKLRMEEEEDGCLYERHSWELTECPHFTVEELKKYIPKYE
jgi:tRNA(His) 5'-end guanylyltransferase